MNKYSYQLSKFKIAEKLAFRRYVAGLLVTMTASVSIAQPAPQTQLRSEPNAQEQANGLSIPLTLQKAISLALEGNPDLSVAKREIEATQGQLLQAQTRPNPELAYSLEDLRSQSRTQSIQLNYPFERGNKRLARMDAAQRGQDAAKEELNVRNTEIRANVVAAFFDTLAAQERVTLAQDSTELARKATDAASKRVAAGKVSPVEETKARIAESGARIELTQSISEQRNAKNRLASLLGNSAPKFSLVSGNLEMLPAAPTADSIQQRLSVSPALRRAQLEVERRKSLSDVERSKQTPDLTFSLGMRRANELQRNQLLFGISVPLQLSDRNQGNLLEALKREEKARDELVALSVRAGAEAMQAREKLESARSEVNLLQRDVLPGARSAYDAATIGFENGKFNFLEVLDAQRTLFSAKSQYLRAVAETHRAASDIDRVLGAESVKPAQSAN